MLTEAYIEALLVDEELADLAWGTWDVGLIDDELVTITWLLIAISSAEYLCRKGQSRATHRRPLGQDLETRGEALRHRTISPNKSPSNSRMTSFVLIGLFK